MLSTVFNRVIRFINGTTAQIQDYNIDNFLDMFFMATSATAGTRLASSCKVRKIEIRTPAYNAAGTLGATATTAQSALQWYAPNTGGIGGPGMVHEDIALGSNDVAFVSSRPPRNCLAAMWMSASSSDTEPIVRISYGPNAVVDMHMTFVMPEGAVGAGDAPVACVRVIAGATAGQFYTSQYPAGGTALVPVQCLSI